MKNNKIIIITISAFLIGIMAAFVYFNTKGSDSTLTNQNLAENNSQIKELLTGIINPEAKIEGVSSEKVYKVELSAKGVKDVLYISPDKKFLFGKVADIEKVRQQIEEEKKPLSIRQVDDTDHIVKGDKNAKVFVIEYSDLECPYCKRFEEQGLAQLKEKYKNNSDVAFVFRQFPLKSIHPEAFKEAVALECIAKEQGGSQGLENLKNNIFAGTKSNGKMSDERLFEITKNAGFDVAMLKKCMNDEKMKDIVTKSYNEAIQSKLTGTPSILVQKGNETFKVNPVFSEVDTKIQELLKK